MGSEERQREEGGREGGREGERKRERERERETERDRERYQVLWCLFLHGHQSHHAVFNFLDLTYSNYLAKTPP
jgi:hypothetical protein